MLAVSTGIPRCALYGQVISVPALVSQMLQLGAPSCYALLKIVTFSFFKMTGDIHSKRLELRIFQLLMPLRRVMPQDVVSSCLKFRQETPNRLHRLHLIQSLLNRKLPIFKRCLRIHSNHDIHLASGNLDTGLNLGRTKQNLVCACTRFCMFFIIVCHVF